MKQHLSQIVQHTHPTSTDNLQCPLISTKRQLVNKTENMKVADKMHFTCRKQHEKLLVSIQF